MNRTIIWTCCLLATATIFGCKAAEPASQPDTKGTASRVEGRTGGRPVSEDLEMFLTHNPELRLLSYEDIGEWKKQVEKSNFSPTADVDVNADGLKDSIAVIVREAGNMRSYGVLVLHGQKQIGSEAEPVWIQPLGKEMILGVSASDRTVQPIACYSCDYVSTYHWSGEGYELGIHLPHDRVCVKPGTIIRSLADIDSHIVFQQPETIGYVEVLELGHKATTDSRWHKVRLLQFDPNNRAFEAMQSVDPEVTGFMDSTGFQDDGGC